MNLDFDLLGPPSDPPITEHTELEIAAIERLGRPLEDSEHVLGCMCTPCRGKSSQAVLKLYDFQAEAVEKLRANIRAGVINQILAAPTGSGKTIMATHLLEECHAKGKRAVFVADRIALIDQTSAVLDRFGIPHGVIQGQHWRCRPWERIQVASPQTMARRKWPEADLIIVDEAHTLHKTTLRQLDKREAVAIGLTATPFTKGMGKHYETVVSVTTTRKLIEEGYLAPYRIFASSEPDMDGAKVVAGEWTEKDSAERAMPIVGDCVSEYLKHGDGQKFIAFGVNVAHCEEIQRQFLAAGMQSGLYTYRTTEVERAEMVAEFRKPDSYIRGLVSVSALAKGFDVEDVGVVIMARPLRSSLAEHIQILGRGLRKDPENPDKICTVLDHAGNTLRFWDSMNAFFDEGATQLDDGKPKKSAKADRKGPKPKKCPKCAHIHAPRPMCPMCGFEYPRRSNVEHEAGELAELGEGAAATIDVRRSFYAELLTLAEARDYKQGWAAHKYRERFGMWPRLGDVEPAPVSRATHNWVKSRQIAWAKRRQA